MYAADLCRTWPVSGRFTPEQRKYYDIVLEAQEAAIEAVKPGVMMVDVIKVAARVFQKYGLEQYEDVAKMGEDKVWGIMPSPTHYLTRDAGIVRYSRARARCARPGPPHRARGDGWPRLLEAAGARDGDHDRAEDVHPGEEHCDHDRGHDPRDARVGTRISRRRCRSEREDIERLMSGRRAR